MKIYVMLLALLATGAAAQAKPDYESCDIAAQHAVKGKADRNREDATKSHFVLRLNILEADIGQARRSRRITERQRAGLQHRLDRISHEADRLAARQGFVSAAERATFDRQLDGIAFTLCR